MALIKCRECKTQISSKAKTCPSCGAPVKKKTSLFTWLVLALIVFIIYSAGHMPKSTRTTNGPAQTTELSEEKKADIAKRVQQSYENDLIVKVKRHVKNAMKDPASADFKNVYFHSTQKGGDVVCGLINSKNSLGGFTGYQGFISNTKTLFLEEKDSNFKDIWKQVCL